MSWNFSSANRRRDYPRPRDHGRRKTALRLFYYLSRLIKFYIGKAVRGRHRGRPLPIICLQGAPNAAHSFGTFADAILPSDQRLLDCILASRAGRFHVFAQFTDGGASGGRDNLSGRPESGASAPATAPSQPSATAVSPATTSSPLPAAPAAQTSAPATATVIDDAAPVARPPAEGAADTGLAAQAPGSATVVSSGTETAVAEKAFRMTFRRKECSWRLIGS